MAADDIILRVQGRVDQILGELARLVMEEMERLVATLDTREGRLERTSYNLRNLADIRDQIRATALRYGRIEVARLLTDALPVIVEERLRELPELGNFRAEVTPVLERFLDGFEREIAANFDDAAEEMASALRRGLSGLPLRETLQEVAQRLDTSLGRASVAIEGTMRRFQERAVVELGDAAGLDGDEFGYLYVGPDDTKTRPYCDARVGKVLTAKQARALDPAQRWNCRHDLAPIAMSEARERGLPMFEG